MKKALIILLLISFLLSGCQTDVEEATATSISSQSESVEDTSVQTDSTTESATTLPTKQETAPSEETLPQEVENQSPPHKETTPASPTDATEDHKHPANQEKTEAETEPVVTTPTVTPETQPTTEPAHEQTEPTELQQEPINAASIESSAESYAATLGFVVDNSLGKGTAGYYPPDYRPYTSMQESIDAACGLVAATKNQLNSRFSTEYSDFLVEGAYGLARVNCQVVFSHSDELGDWYYIYVFYG